MLVDRGFVRVRPLSGGLDAWLDAGHEFDLHEQAPAAMPALDR